jgi:hypothetical protein
LCAWQVGTSSISATHCPQFHTPARTHARTRTAIRRGAAHGPSHHTHAAAPGSSSPGQLTLLTDRHGAAPRCGGGGGGGGGGWLSVVRAQE